MKTCFRMLSLFLAALITGAVVQVTAAPAMAASTGDGVYTVTLNRSYFDPNTGADASGNTTNQAIGQGMVESAVSSTGLLEVVDGTCYLTIRIILASSISNFSAFVRASGSTGYSEGGYSGVSVTKTQSSSANNTVDYCFKIPSTSCTVAGGMYVAKMGSDVVFFLTLGSTTVGSGDFTVTHYQESTGTTENNGNTGSTGNNSGNGSTGSTGNNGGSGSTGSTGNNGGSGSTGNTGTTGNNNGTGGTETTSPGSNETEEPKETVDTAALEAAVSQAEALQEEDYTADSWSALQTALTAAQETASDETAGQEAVDAAAAALTEAMDALEAAADTTELEELTAQAEALAGEDYTEESWAALAEALTAARDALNAEEATQETLDAAAAALAGAIDGLEAAETVDKAALEGLISQAKALAEADYTAESWTALTDALTAAETVAADEGATHEDVDAAAAALETAISQLAERSASPVGIVIAVVVVLAVAGAVAGVVVYRKRQAGSAK